jgi:ATP-dependent Clp protease adaptor protein ClpS
LEILNQSQFESHLTPFTIIMGDSDEEGEGSVVLANKKKTKRPKRYKVLLHNDDYTTMEFVIFVLKAVFRKGLEESQAIMLEVHNKGAATCGIYSHEIAETLCQKVHSLARENKHPLKSSIEEE